MRALLILLAGLFVLLLTRPALADMSCYINEDAAGAYAVGNSPLMVLEPGKVTTPTRLNATYTFVIPFRGGNPLGCKTLEPWDNAVHFITDAGASLDTRYTTPEGYALIKTTIPGIDFTLELTCYTADGCGNSGDHPDLSLFLKGGNGSEDVFPSISSGYPWESADAQWRLKMTMWVTPDFRPQKGVPNGFSLNGTLARFQIGGTTQPVITFVASSSTLNFTVPASSCALGVAQGSNVSNNNVALGDYFLSDVKQEMTREIPFSLTLENCYTAKLLVKMTTAYLSADNELLGKSSGSASGMGVKVTNTDKNLSMMPDGSNSAVYDRSNDWSAQENLNFSAQLKKDGQTLKAGDFNAAATFTLDYE